MIQQIFDPLTTLGQSFVPNLVGAVIILILGWLLALVLGAVARGTLRRTGLSDRLGLWIYGRERARSVDIARTTGRAVYYVVMLFVVMGFLQVLRLSTVTEPINGLLSQLFEFLPQLLAAALLIFAAWVVASILRFLVSRVLQSSRLSEMLRNQADIDASGRYELHKVLGEVVYWFVFLLFFPAILGTLSLEGLLAPVQSMLNNFLGFLPNLFGAALILLAGWVVARVVKQIVIHLLEALHVDDLGKKAGLRSVVRESSVARIVGIVVYALILIPVIISALNALQLTAITAPASNMLDTLWGVVPSLFSAVLVLFVAYMVGRILAGLVTSLLENTRFDQIFVGLRLAKEPPSGSITPSIVVGRLVLIAIMFFAIAEAFRMLGFAVMTSLTHTMLVLAGKVIIGLLVAVAGIFIANLVSDVIHASGSSRARTFALVSRVAILSLVGALALEEIGLATEIITLAFGLLLGGVVVAVAIAFGIGGREAAARQIESWRGSSGS